MKVRNILSAIILIIVLSITVGYAASVSEMSISNVVAEVRIKTDIRITDVSLVSESSNDIIPNSLDYDVDSILPNVSFNSLSSYVMYKVTITNIESAEMGVFQITGLPNDVSYELIDYNLKDKLCDSTGQCNLGISKDFYIKLYPTSDSGVITHNLNIDFDFRSIHKITYTDINVDGTYPTEVMDGGNLKITFTNDAPNDVIVYSDGIKVDSSKYKYYNGTLELNNVTGDLNIRKDNTLYRLIKLKTNGVDTNIDFAVASSSTNGEGVNTVSGTENDEYPVYYYRGAVTDNNVIFANFCWKIVRTTETGGVKLIYNGVPAEDGSCNNTGTESQIGESDFASSSTSAASVGYMYGTNYSISMKTLSSQSEAYVYGNTFEWNETNYTLLDTTISSSWGSDREKLATKYHYTCFNSTGVCSSIKYIVGFVNSSKAYYISLSNGKDIEEAKNEMFTNKNNSQIKKTIDTWYESNMTSYTNQLEDTVWCNDRTIIDGTLLSKDTNSKTGAKFAANSRNTDIFKPSIACPNIRDSFTVDISNGNGKLTYPVGLLTADECTMAGNGENYDKNNPAYLFTGEGQLTLSPSSMGGSINSTVIFFVYPQYGQLAANTSSIDSGVRPSISLKPDIMVESGDGSVTNPYVVQSYSVSG